MNTPAKPVPLHAHLQFICRVHGLTPHSSTGRSPYELIKEGPTASLFPLLTKSTQKAAELTAVRQTKGSGNRKTFIEGEYVTVYDFKTKLTKMGLVKRVLGANTYKVDCGGGYLQHISGDAMSKTNLIARELGRPELTTQLQLGRPELTAQQENLGDQEESEVIEQDSDSSDDEEDYGHSAVVPAQLPRRRRGRMAVGLGPVQPTRLRPRR